MRNNLTLVCGAQKGLWVVETLTHCPPTCLLKQLNMSMPTHTFVCACACVYVCVCVCVCLGVLYLFREEFDEKPLCQLP